MQSNPPENFSCRKEWCNLTYQDDLIMAVDYYLGLVGRAKWHYE